MLANEYFAAPLKLKTAIIYADGCRCTIFAIVGEIYFSVVHIMVPSMCLTGRQSCVHRHSWLHWHTSYLLNGFSKITHVQFFSFLL